MSLPRVDLISLISCAVGGDLYMPAAPSFGHCILQVMASFFSKSLVPFALLSRDLVAAATVNLDWNITWVTANPDGMLERPVIGINGQWPPPLLNFTKGDRVIANVYNALGNETTSIHFHGFYQNGTNNMDGPPGVVQCEIPPESTFTYNFRVSLPTGV